MSYYVFDSPRWGLLIALVLEVLLVVGYAFSEGRRVKRWWLLFGPALVVVVLVMDRLVETNREQLAHITEEIVRAAEQEDAAGIIRHIHNEIQLPNGVDKAQAAAVIEEKLAEPLIAENNLERLSVIRVTERLGAVEFKVTTRMEVKSRYAVVPIVTTGWRFDYTRAAGGEYQVTNITMLWLTPGLGGQRQKPIDVFTYDGRL